MRRRELAPKTVTNARTYLSAVLNEAVRRGHLAESMRLHPQLPADSAEIDFLRLSEVGPAPPPGRFTEAMTRSRAAVDARGTGSFHGKSVPNQGAKPWPSMSLSSPAPGLDVP